MVLTEINHQHYQKLSGRYSYDTAYNNNQIYVLEDYHTYQPPFIQSYNLYLVENQTLKLIKTIGKPHCRHSRVHLLFYQARPYILRIITSYRQGEGDRITIDDFEGNKQELPDIGSIIDWCLSPDRSTILMVGERSHQRGSSPLLLIHNDRITIGEAPFEICRIVLSPDRRYIACQGKSFPNGDKRYLGIIDCQTLQTRYMEVENQRTDIVPSEATLGFTTDSQCIFLRREFSQLSIYTKELKYLENINILERKLGVEHSKIIGNDDEIVYDCRKRSIIIRSTSMEFFFTKKQYTIYQIDLERELIEKQTMEIEVNTNQRCEIMYYNNDFVALKKEIHYREEVPRGLEEKPIKLYIYQEPGKRTKVAKK